MCIYIYILWILSHSTWMTSGKNAPFFLKKKYPTIIASIVVNPMPQTIPEMIL